MSFRFFRPLVWCTTLSVLMASSCRMPSFFKKDEKTQMEIPAGTVPAKPGPAEDSPPNAPYVFGKHEAGEDHYVAIMKLRVNGQVRTVRFLLLPEYAPLTVQNFASKASEGFYDGLAIHRAIKDYLVQMGDPLTREQSTRAEWGTGGPGHTIPAEIKAKHTRGAVVAARLGDEVNPKKESSGSQFYIVLGDLSSLDGQYTVFGQVFSGLNVLDEISKSFVDSNGVPVERYEIKDISIRKTKNPPRTFLSESLERRQQNEETRFGTMETQAGEDESSESTTTKEGKKRGFFGRLWDRLW